VWLLETGGKQGVAALGQEVSPGSDLARIVGWVVFEGTVVYRSSAEFWADASRHRVPPEGTPYGWIEGTPSLFSFVSNIHMAG
jgi:hypothetical protein